MSSVAVCGARSASWRETRGTAGGGVSSGCSPASELSDRPPPECQAEDGQHNAGHPGAAGPPGVGGWVELTGLGTAFVLLQAAAVVVFALMQVTGLRRARNRDAALV